MSGAERRWIKDHRRDPDVRAWLRDNPPPAEWEGTAMQWAFTERPEPGRVLPTIAVGLGLLGAAWLATHPAPVTPPRTAP